MNNLIRVLKLIFVFLFLLNDLFAQISSGGKPYSFSHNIAKTSDVIRMRQFDVEALIEEDKNIPKDLPYRFGYGFDVNYNLNNSGNWIQLEDSSRLWCLHIKSEGAYSLNLIYEKFWLPDSAKFFIYNVDKSMVIGAFTSRNNKHHGKFATGLVEGDEIILEYQEPLNVKKEGEICISRIVHAYKNLFDFSKLYKTTRFGSSGGCNNNVYCSEAVDWENEIHSVGRLIVENGTALCTGSLINNVKQNYAPYLLTANHCLGGDVSNWVIWFNYESSTCSNPSSAPSYQSLSGATLKSNNSASDFALVLLDETPPLNYNVYYNGWSNIDISPSSTVCIHHPRGDIKKISYDDDSAVSSDYDPEPYLANSHWEVVWDDGTTEVGSSGSPLIDQNHRVIGQLHGGWASCSEQNSSDYYGKFSMSWDYGSSASTRLKDWLDPDNSGVTTLDGLDNGMLSSGIIPANVTWSGTNTLTGNIIVPSGITLTLSSTATINLNSYSLISTGGTIAVETGATINGLRATLKERNVIRGYCGTVQGAITGAENNNIIDIVDGVYNESISIYGKDYLHINDGEITGIITISNSDYLWLDQTKCSSIYVNNSIDPYFNCVQAVGSGSGTGLSIFNVTNPFMGSSKLVCANFSTGLYAINSTFGMEHYPYSWLYGATDGISANYNSSITLNSVVIAQNSRYDLASYTNSNISASYCYFDNGTPVIHESGGNVDAINNQVYVPAKKGTITSGSMDEIEVYSIDNGFGKINNQYYNFTKQVRADFEESKSFDKEKYKDGFIDIANQFKKYIKENSGSKYKGAAVTTAIHCCKSVKDYEAMKAFIDEIKDDKEIGAYAERFMIDYYQEQEAYEKAIAKADELLEKADDDLTITLLYSKGLIYGHDMDEPEEAIKCFAKIVKDYPNDGMADMALNQLSIFGVKELKEITDENETDESLELRLTNSPNPFNPTTTISYQIPEQGFVTLKVYDMLGREVADLVNNKMEAGKYSVNFNASNLASGVYIYRINVQSFEGSKSLYSKTEKMMLLK